VLPGGASAFLSPDPAAFRARAASPKGGEGLLLLQAPAGLLAAADGDGRWAVLDPSGRQVSSKAL
jgi:hypothetical protein